MTILTEISSLSELVCGLNGRHTYTRNVKQPRKSHVMYELHARDLGCHKEDLVPVSSPRNHAFLLDKSLTLPSCRLASESRMHAWVDAVQLHHFTRGGPVECK